MCSKHLYLGTILSTANNRGVFRDFPLPQCDSRLAALLVGFIYFTCFYISVHLIQSLGVSSACDLCLGSSLGGMDRSLGAWRKQQYCQKETGSLFLIVIHTYITKHRLSRKSSFQGKPVKHRRGLGLGGHQKYTPDWLGTCHLGLPGLWMENSCRLKGGNVGHRCISYSAVLSRIPAKWLTLEGALDDYA